MQTISSSYLRRLGLSVIVALALPWSAAAQSTDTGVIAGRVSNAATRYNLEGASIRLDGTSYATTTERDGTYRLEVPPGRYSLIASYTGLDDQVLSVAVDAGTVVRHELALTSVIYKMDKVVVPGEREGNALALTIQQEIPNIKNVVSADAFGSLAGNPADLLQRLPGLAGESVDGDIRYIQVRGISRNLNTVTVDGNRMADAASAGTSREYQFQQISSDTIERMEVTKSPTPDMDSDSIGGAINMVSKSAFDSSQRRRISGSIGSSWKPTDVRDENHPNFSLSYSEVFGDRLGVTFSAGARSHLASSDKADQIPQDTLADPHYIYSLSLRDSRNTRTRWGGGVKLDYKLTDSVRVFLNTTLNRHDENSNHNLFLISTAQTIATLDASGNPTGSGAILPNFTMQKTEWRPITNSIAQLTSNANNKHGRTIHTQVGAVHTYEGLDIDYDAYMSESSTRYESPGNAGFQLTARGIGIRLDQTGDPFYPQFTQTGGPNMFDITTYKENLLTVERSVGIDRYLGAALNAKKDLPIAKKSWIKAGVRWREQTRDLSNSSARYNYIGPGGNMATADLSPFVNHNLKYNLSGRYHQFPSLPFPTHAFRSEKSPTLDYSGPNIGTALLQNPQFFAEDIAWGIQQGMGNAQDFKEAIGAGYVMGNVELGKLNILAGVRVEKTKTEGTGPVIGVTPAEKARRAAWTGAVTPDELRRRTIAEYSQRRTATGQYTDAFPGLHLKYEAIDGLIFRASYATNIGRPAIGSLIPRTTVNYDSRSVSTNNPSLLPQYADNYDASVEYYFKPVGLLSVGFFDKEISNFIYTLGGQIIGSGANNGFNGDYEGFTLSSSANGGSARVRGFELAYQQQLTFLPGWLGGFGVYANYTRMDTKGDYGTNTVTSTNQVAGFYPEMGNAGVSYIRSPVSIRVQFNYVSRYLNTFSSSQARLYYRLARPTLDIKTVYNLSDHFDFYLDVTNLFAQPDRSWEYWGGRPGGTEWMRPELLFGVNCRL
jgi:iron complex outermembrane recepter protein